MPAYDFRCTECDENFEVTRPMSSTGEERCPACGAVARKVFSPFGVAFKGSGFHNTDYKPRPKDESGPPSSPAKTEAPACPASGGSSACSSCPAAN